MRIQHASIKIWGLCGLLLLAILGAAMGCARLGEEFIPHTAPADAPPVEDILADLSENQAALRNFSAQGEVTIQSPELRATQRLRSRVAFQRPRDLYVEGRHRMSGAMVCRLTASGDEFLIEFPTEDAVFHHAEDAPWEDRPFSIAPGEAVTEMFMAEEWEEIPEQHARVMSYDADTGVAVLEIGPADQPRRRVHVQGPPWVVVRNERLGAWGGVISITELGDYREMEGMRFPAFIDAEFPPEDARMRFDMRTIEANTELDHDLFTIDWRRVEDAAASDRADAGSYRVEP